MDRGDEIRKQHLSGNAVALLGVKHLISRRQELYPHAEPALNGTHTHHPGMRTPQATAWIFDGLMHPDEIQLLQSIYGKRFFALSCDTPLSLRLDWFTRKLSRESAMAYTEAEVTALRLIHRNAGMPVPDCSEYTNRKSSAQKPTQARESTTQPSINEQVEPKYKLCVDKAFRMGDAFVRCDHRELTRRVITTLVQSIMSYPFHTPTLDEIGMAVAYQASLASSSLSRRVGAALMRDEQIIGIGCNEVPKSGGGIYHAESCPDGRELALGGDPSDQVRMEILSDLLARLPKDLFKASKESPSDLAIEAMKHREVRDSQLFDIIEYTRCAHAEIVTITSAARRGATIQDATLFCTTMPCHECMRAVVASGISRVVYVEPYPKSKGAHLQADSVSLVPLQGERPDKINIEQFSGISYHRFADLFSWLDRKQDDIEDSLDRQIQGLPDHKTHDGFPVQWNPRESRVRPSLFDSSFPGIELLVQYLREADALERLKHSASSHTR